MDKTRKLLKILEGFEAKGKTPTEWSLIRSTIKASLSSNSALTLISFTCSTINPKYMFDLKNPEYYVSLNPKGNNLENDLQDLVKLYTKLSLIYPTKITIIIGNTDPFYIYTQEAKKLSISQSEFWKRYSQRWNKYRSNLAKSITQSCPNLNFEVISWYDLERQSLLGDFQKQFQSVLSDITNYFSKEDLDYELSKLAMAFGKGRYFYNLTRPPKATLKTWVKRKFAEYAVQGLWIKQLFPNAILIQNEKPSELRTKMYRPLIVKILDSKLPVIYPYGVDNEGYQ